MVREELGGSLSLYFQDIRDYPLLTAEEEVELAKLIEVGGEEGKKARDKMVESNQRLIVNIAKRYQECGVDLIDLISSGNLGLIRATEKWSWQKGYKFSTYATWWVVQAITRCIHQDSRTMRLPVHTGEWISSLKRVSQQLEQELGGKRKPTLEEIANESGFSVKKVKMLMRVSRSPLSLELPVGDENGESVLGDFVEDKRAIDPGDVATQGSLKEQIQDLLSSLSDRERHIIELRFGLVDGQSRSLEEVGDLIGVTRERIRQIVVKVLRKLRHPIRSRKLKDFREGFSPQTIKGISEEGDGKLYQDPVWLKQKYVVEKLTAKEMGELCSVDKMTIYAYLKKYGISTRSSSAARVLMHATRGDGRNYRNRQWLEQAYQEGGLSLARIAQGESVDVGTILYWMKKFSIPRRTLSEAQRLSKEMRN